MIWILFGGGYCPSSYPTSGRLKCPGQSTVLHTDARFTVPKMDTSNLKQCANARQLKQIFRRVALQYHPDVFAARLNEEYPDKTSPVFVQIENEILQNFLQLKEMFEKKLYDFEHPDETQHTFSLDPNGTDPWSNIIDPRQTWRDWFYHVCPLTENFNHYVATPINPFSGSGITWSIYRQHNYRIIPREIVKQITISFTDSLIGLTMPYEVQDLIPCEHCNHRGYVFVTHNDPNATTSSISDAAACTMCNGSGTLRTIWNDGTVYRSSVSSSPSLSPSEEDHHSFHDHDDDHIHGNNNVHRHGMEYSSRTCIHCCGTGHGPTVLCPVCLGQGSIPRTIPGVFRIPPGISTHSPLWIRDSFIPHPIDPPPVSQLYPFVLNVTVDPATVTPWKIADPHIQRYSSISLRKYCLLNHTLITLPSTEKINVTIEPKDCCGNGGTHNIFIPGYGLLVSNGKPVNNPIGSPLLINNRGHIIITLIIKYPLRINEDDAVLFSNCFGKYSLDLLYSISDVLMEVSVNQIDDDITDSKYVLYSCDAGNPQRTLLYHTVPEFLIDEE